MGKAILSIAGFTKVVDIDTKRMTVEVFIPKPLDFACIKKSPKPDDIGGVTCILCVSGYASDGTPICWRSCVDF